MGVCADNNNARVGGIYRGYKATKTECKIRRGRDAKRHPANRRSRSFHQQKERANASTSQGTAAKKVIGSDSEICAAFADVDQE